MTGTGTRTGGWMSLGQVEQTPAAAQSGGELEGEGQEGLLRSGAAGGRR